MPYVTLCTYNIWALRYPKRMRKFLSNNDVDIFGFTEVTDIKKLENGQRATCYSSLDSRRPAQVDAYQELRSILGARYYSQYDAGVISPWTCAKSNEIFWDVGFGSALFWKRNIKPIDRVAAPIAGEKNTNPRCLQAIIFERQSKVHMFAHLHGIWIRENTKGDHPLRTEQSQLVLEHLGALISEYKVSKIVFGGDLNLDIDTEALAILEAGDNGTPPLRNLVREFNITSTRTKEYRDYDRDQPQYADYMLVSDNVEVESFNVSDTIDASDHKPLILRYN